MRRDYGPYSQVSASNPYWTRYLRRRISAAETGPAARCFAINLQLIGRLTALFQGLLYDSICRIASVFSHSRCREVMSSRLLAIIAQARLNSQTMAGHLAALSDTAYAA